MGLKFRKKPVVIEAFQMTLDECRLIERCVLGARLGCSPSYALRNAAAHWPAWLLASLDKSASEVGSLFWCTDMVGGVLSELRVRTLEGALTISADDWIIRGVKGELYPCKPDIFAATYEEVPDGEACGTGAGAQAGSGSGGQVETCCHCVGVGIDI